MAYVIAKAQFHSQFGRVEAGEAYAPEDPVVRAFPDNFCTPDEWAQSKAARRVLFGPGPAVEQATAAPGQKRSVRRVDK